MTVQEPPRRRPEGEGGGARVALAFESAALGRLDLRIDLATGRVDVGVAANAGRPFELADAGAERPADRPGGERRPAGERSRDAAAQPLDLYA